MVIKTVLLWLWHVAWQFLGVQPASPQAVWFWSALRAPAMRHCSNRVAANPAKRTNSQSIAYRTKLENSWKSWLWLHWEKLLNTNPTSSFTPVRNVAAHISLAGLYGDDWVAIGERGAHMNSSKPYPDWLSLPMTNCLKHRNIIFHTWTVGFFQLYLFRLWKISLLPTRYAPNLILGPWFHSMKLISFENPFSLISHACAQPSATTHHPGSWAYLWESKGILGHREATEIFNHSVAG